jgi:hypothetical protein
MNVKKLKEILLYENYRPFYKVENNKIFRATSNRYDTKMIKHDDTHYKIYRPGYGFETPIYLSDKRNKGIIFVESNET